MCKHKLWLFFFSVLLPLPIWAEAVKFYAVLSTEGDQNLEFPSDDQRVVRLVQRRGAVTGTGALASSQMLEWGVHDIGPELGSGEGFLVFNKSDQNKAYLSFEWQAIRLTTKSGDRFILKGSWRVVSGSGLYENLQGLGNLSIDVLSTTQRRWIFDGELQLNEAE